MQGESNATAFSTPRETKRHALRMMLDEARRETEQMGLGFSAYMIGLAIQSFDEPDQERLMAEAATMQPERVAT